MDHQVVFGRGSIPALDTELTGVPSDGWSKEGKGGAQVVLVVQQGRTRGGPASLETLSGDAINAGDKEWRVVVILKEIVSHLC